MEFRFRAQETNPLCNAVGGISAGNSPVVEGLSEAHATPCGEGQD